MTPRPHKVPRPRFAFRTQRDATRKSDRVPAGPGAKLMRYVIDGVPSRTPQGTTVTEALRYGQSGPNRMSMLLYAEPSVASIEELAQAWDLHPVLVEDLLQGQQRIKLERYDDVLFLVARSAWYVDADESVEFAEFHILLRPHAIVLLCHDWRWIDGSDVTAFDLDHEPIPGHRARGLLDNPELMRLGPEAVAYQLLDAIVDGYGPVLEGLAIDKDQIERQVFSGDATAAERIYRLSQEAIDLKQACTSLATVVSALTAGFEKYNISLELRTYLADLADHLTRVEAEVVELRNSLTQILTVNATLVGQRQNEDMKKISGWAAILFAPTLIAAIYGMNFDDMPELHWAFGYPLAIGMMVAFASALYWIFKKRRWM